MDFNQFSKLYEVSLFNEVFDNRYLAVYNNSKSKESFKHNMLRVLLEEQPT
jgi:hypothetical protein